MAVPRAEGAQPLSPPDCDTGVFVEGYRFEVVALGAPKQEFFIDKYADEIGARIAIGVGGALDLGGQCISCSALDIGAGNGVAVSHAEGAQPLSPPDCDTGVFVEGYRFEVVALGAPKQEFFIDKYADEIGARIAIGVGGALDVWAGNVSRAPRWISALGMEWLYRALKEPSRFRRLTAIPVFLSKVIASK